jgi:hypothetical protein
MKHLRGIINGQKWLYCPIGHIVSWHPTDHDKGWCAHCNEFVLP